MSEPEAVRIANEMSGYESQVVTVAHTGYQGVPLVVPPGADLERLAATILDVGWEGTAHQTRYRWVLAALREVAAAGRREGLEAWADLLEEHAVQERRYQPVTYAQNYTAEVLEVQARRIRALKGQDP